MPDPEFVVGVSGGGKLTADEAVAVYSRGYVARLTEALGETFEGCWRVLGDDLFFAAAADHIRRNPSQSANLSDYGEHFLQHEASELHEFPFLGDLARFEWAFKEVFHSAPSRGLSATELASSTRPDSKFRFVSALRLMSLAHRVYAIWKRDRGDDTPLDPRQWEGAQALLIYKKEGNEIFIREIGGCEHATLAALVNGSSVADALEGASGMNPESAQSLFTLIADERLVAEVQ